MDLGLDPEVGNSRRRERTLNQQEEPPPFAAMCNEVRKLIQWPNQDSKEGSRGVKGTEARARGRREEYQLARTKNDWSYAFSATSLAS